MSNHSSNDCFGLKLFVLFTAFLFHIKVFVLPFNGSKPNLSVTYSGLLPLFIINSTVSFPVNALKLYSTSVLYCN